jgi:processive 1,2-diacylglycerol beta-glucosyltransferase
MIELLDKDSGGSIGSISEEQLRFLTEQLEEETDVDRDYYVDRATLAMFAERGIDPQLLSLLRGALGDRDEMEIEWVRR